MLLSFTHLTVLTTAATLISASPISIHKRAGGPIAQPVPSNCTIINPLPGSQSTTCNSSNTTPSNTTTTYQPSQNFTTTHSLYASYFPPTDFSPSDQATHCLEQCYGFGTKGTCLAAISAFNVPTPDGYEGTAGGVLSTACLLFDAWLTPLDFEVAESGQWSDEGVGDIYCPA